MRENKVRFRKTDFLPLFSLIIPVYNVLRYLPQCLESVKDQTYKNIEVIIVDDGSTDGSDIVCDSYAGEFSNVKIIHKRNGGLSDARNEGVKVADGDYIAFLDSDDYISPCFFETVAAAITKYHVDMVAIKRAVTFWDGEREIKVLKNSVDHNTIEYVDSVDALERMFYLEIETGAPFIVVRHEVWSGIEFPKGYAYEDLATTYKAYLSVDKVAIIDGDLYAYRKRKGSIIRQGFNQEKAGIVEVANNVIDDIGNRLPALSRAAVYRVFSPLFSVYLQVPQECHTLRKKIWDEITKYRFQVLTVGRRIRKKDRIAAFISYFGMDVSYYLGTKFGQRGTMY